MKRVSNPLTIIAIFAGLSESISGLIIGFAENDAVIKYFLVGFPLILVILFFLTLNFNSKVLYSPSDFKDDQNYLKALEIGKRPSDKLKIQINEIKQLIDNLSTNQGNTIEDEKIVVVKEKLTELENTNNNQVNARLFLSIKKEFQNEILSYIKNKLQKANYTPLTIAEIKNESKFSEPEVRLAMAYLENEWVVSYNKEKEGYVLEQD